MKLSAFYFKNRCSKAPEVTESNFSPLPSLLALLRDPCSLEICVTKRLDEGGEEFKEAERDMGLTRLDKDNPSLKQAGGSGNGMV